MCAGAGSVAPHVPQLERVTWQGAVRAMLDMREREPTDTAKVEFQRLLSRVVRAVDAIPRAALHMLLHDTCQTELADVRRVLVDGV